MTDTPETDAAEVEIIPSRDPNYDGPYQWVEAFIARSLERRLQEAQRQNREIIALMQRTEDRLEIALCEVEELRQQNITFRNAQKACEDCDAPTMAEVARLREALHEKDEARKQAERYQWLREHRFVAIAERSIDETYREYIVPHGMVLCLREQLDAFIDAALAEKGKP